MFCSVFHRPLQNLRVRWISTSPVARNATAFGTGAPANKNASGAMKEASKFLDSVAAESPGILVLFPKFCPANQLRSTDSNRRWSKPRYPFSQTFCFDLGLCDWTIVFPDTYSFILDHSALRVHAQVASESFLSFQETTPCWPPS